MKRLELRRTFKRGLKRMLKRGHRRDKLDSIVDDLMGGRTLSYFARPHKLSGEWDGFWECHIESDWLLIYDSTDEAVLLAATGTHEDLFE